jgi:hypothetical protein
MTKASRMPGFFYLGMILCGLFAQLVRSNILASQDIAGSLMMLRFSFISDLTMMVFYLLTAWALYINLKHIEKSLSLLFLVLTIVSVAILSGNMINHIAIIEIQDSSYFKTDDLYSLTEFLTKLHEYGYLIAQVYFGLWLLPLGMIILKSGIMPKFIGLALIAATIGHLIEVFITFLIPRYCFIAYPGLVLGMIGEFSFCFWLLLKGLNNSHN